MSSSGNPDRSHLATVASREGPGIPASRKQHWETEQNVFNDQANSRISVANYYPPPPPTDCADSPLYQNSSHVSQSVRSTHSPRTMNTSQLSSGDSSLDESLLSSHMHSNLCSSVHPSPGGPPLTSDDSGYYKTPSPVGHARSKFAPRGAQKHPGYEPQFTSTSSYSETRDRGNQSLNSSTNSDYSFSDSPISPQNLVKLSKALSYILRHGAGKKGLTLMPGGFLYVDDLLKLQDFRNFTADHIQRVVDTNEKKRFHMEVDEDTQCLKIRANQGHSVKVEGLALAPITHPDQFPDVIHGTYHHFWDSIRIQGLKKMNRNHIHFAAGVPGVGEVISGMRKSCAVIICIDMAAALKDGLEFFLSANNVILSPGDSNGVILPRYFSKVIDRKSGMVLH